MVTVDDALRKLAPLRPDEVRRWKKQLPFLDEKTRKLVEWKILRTASELLGDVDERLLLSCPPPEVCKGDVELGSVMYERPLWPFCLREKELLQHLAVFGRSGSGKSNLVFHILRQLVERKVPFLLFDWKRGYRDLMPSLGSSVQVLTPGRSVVPFRFNPFLCPPGVERHVHITLVVDLLGRAFTLGDGAKSLLHRALHSCAESPGVAELLSLIENMEAKGRQQGWRASAVRCLQTLLYLDIVPSETASQAEVVEQFFTRSSILELNGLNEGAKRFLIPSVLHWVYSVRLASPDREKLRLVVGLEEAHHVLGDRQSEHFFSRFLRQCRELGIAVVLVDQAPSLLSSAALGNCFSTVALNLKDPDDVRVAGSVLQMSQKERGWLSRLPLGTAVLKLQDRWRSPFVIQVPHVAIQKGSMSDEQLRLYMVDQVGRQTGSTRSTPRSSGNEQVRRVRFSDEVHAGPSFEFLLDVLAHPDAGVKERYRRLGWSVDRGNKVKIELLKVGLLEGDLVSLGRTRKLVLRPTAEGRELLGLGNGASVESLQHEFWKRRMAERFGAEGWQVEVEGLRDPVAPDLGRADLVLQKDAVRWAVEVETGKSDAVQNARNGLLAGFARVLVVPTDEKAREKVERELAGAGLLWSGRVLVSNGSDVRRAPVPKTDEGRRQSTK